MLSSFTAWWCWLPDIGYEQGFPDITFEPGDTLLLAATATSPTTGTVEIGNYRLGVGYVLEITVNSPLCQQNVEWIVEDLTIGGLAPLADWGTVTFTGASATTTSGQQINSLDGADEMLLVLNNGDPHDGTVVSDVSINGDSVTVRYVPPA